MKIAFFGTAAWEKKYLRQRLEDHQLVFYENNNSISDSEAEVLCNFIHFPVTGEALPRFPNLKYITTRSTGYDHIDIAACAAKGIAVSNVPSYGENTVAEFTFALLLALSRKIFPALKRVREEGEFSTEGLQGFDLKGKTIGVIGTGRIGVHVVKIALGFDMRVVAYDPYPNEKLVKEYGIQYLSLENLLAESDVITLHVPYMPATHHLLNKNNLGLVKPGSVLINTARGGLVETEGLIAALSGGRLAGAGLDVLEEEGYIPEEEKVLLDRHPNEDRLKTLLADHSLMQMENVLVTPHNAFNTKEALERILDTTVENIRGFAEGKTVNVVKG